MSHRVEGGGAAVEILLVCAGLGFVGLLVSFWLVFRLWRRRKQLSRGAQVAARCLGLAVLVGAWGTFTGVVKAFGAIGGESVDPSQKARLLAEGISEVMNCAAFCAFLWFPSLVALIVLARKRKAVSR